MFAGVLSSPDDIMCDKSGLLKHPIAIERDKVVQINAGRLIPYFPARVNHRLSFYSLFSLPCYQWLAKMFYTYLVFRREQKPSLFYAFFC